MTDVTGIISSVVISLAAFVSALLVIVRFGGGVSDFMANKLASRVQKDKVSQTSEVYQAFLRDEKFDASLEELKMNMLRLEILQMINLHPDKVEPIMKVYDKYIKKGGNTYVTAVYAEWYEAYGRPIIEGRMPPRRSAIAYGRRSTDAAGAQPLVDKPLTTGV